MVALIVYLVVGLVAIAFGFQVIVAIRGHKKFNNAYLYWDIGMRVIRIYNLEISKNMNRFKRRFLIILNNVAWPYKLYWLIKDIIPMIDKGYMNALERITQKEEL